ncbi:hypothetical protein LTR33_001498 [Friedmanniomyces endolithicus]|nr:hypothetical protein LTR33_001498 [Friedmanniomyces endolithicus]
MSSGSNYDLLATIDSARTIETSKSGPTAHTDAHQRPVQWVPTAIRDRSIAHMLVISPFEAQELYSRVHTSDTVALHLYAPRCNSDFRSLDRLDFYTFSRQVAASMIHPRLVVQLNLFAGQLYISDYEDFKYWVGEEDIPLLLLVGDGVLGKHIGGKRFGGDAEKRVESHAITRLWKLGWKEDVVDERFVRVHRA